MKAYIFSIQITSLDEHTLHTPSGAIFLCIRKTPQNVEQITLRTAMQVLQHNRQYRGEPLHKQQW
jgi:hypothetical protein